MSWQNKGQAFENQVVNYLLKNGYTILGKNQRIAKVEIDILAKKQIQGEEHYFFIECKSHHHPNFPFVSYNQKKRYFKAMRMWVYEFGSFANVHFALALRDPLSREVVFLIDYSIETPT